MLKPWFFLMRNGGEAWKLQVGNVAWRNMQKKGDNSRNVVTISMDKELLKKVFCRFYNIWLMILRFIMMHYRSQPLNIKLKKKSYIGSFQPKLEMHVVNRNYLIYGSRK